MIEFISQPWPWYVAGPAIGLSYVRNNRKRDSCRSNFSSGDLINPADKKFNKKGNLIGGIIFGCGWALTGACPGPLYALVGSGYGIMLGSIFSAMLGVVAYGILKDKLPH
jgi:hypothetical protein